MSAPVLHAITPAIACRQNMPDLVFYCPGCECEHGIWTSKPAPSGAKWTWNGDMVRPTFTPSLVVVLEYPQGHGRAPLTKRCHSYITDGKIQFLSDSSHALAGQTVALEATQ